MKTVIVVTRLRMPLASLEWLRARSREQPPTAKGDQVVSCDAMRSFLGACQVVILRAEEMFVVVLWWIAHADQDVSSSRLDIWTSVTSQAAGHVIILTARRICACAQRVRILFYCTR